MKEKLLSLSPVRATLGFGLAIGAFAITGAIVGTLASMSATQAQADGRKVYLEDLTGACHWIYESELQLNDPEKFKDANGGDCSGKGGTYIGRTFYGKHEGKCAELTPRRTVFKYARNSLCESDF